MFWRHLGEASLAFQRDVAHDQVVSGVHQGNAFDEVQLEVPQREPRAVTIEVGPTHLLQPCQRTRPRAGAVTRSAVGCKSSARD
eukprot:scaffold34929_cov64-Phaeocystis_antarctica.AAC.1